MVNDLIGAQPYSDKVYGNTRNYQNNTKDKGSLCGGTGFSSIKESFETIGGSLQKIYSGNTADVYEIDFAGIENL